MRKLARAAMVLGALAAGGAAAQETPGPHKMTTDRYLDLERLSGAEISPDGSQIVYVRQEVDRMADKWAPSLWIMKADGTENRFLAKGSDAQWSRDSKRILYLGEEEGGHRQIFVRWIAAEGPASQVTRATERLGDARWSPDGKSIAFTEFVPEPPKWTISMPTAPKDAKWTPAPRIVSSLHYRQDRVGFLDQGRTHLFVVSADGGAVRDLTPGKWSVGAGELRGAVSFDWTPDSRAIVVQASRDFDPDLTYERSQLLVVPVADGAARALFAAKGSWDHPKVSPDGATVAFTGYPTGARTHTDSDVFLAPLSGGEPREIGQGFDRDPGALHWARDGSGVFFDADDQGTRNVFFAAAGGGVRPVSRGSHVLTLDSVSDGALAAGTVSDPDHPAEIVRYSLRRPDEITRLTDVNGPLLADVRLGHTQELSWTSSGGVKVHGWYVTPPDFDPTKKYPLVLEIHGGPYASYNVGFSPMWQNFAANGFVVLYLNPRGSTGYGQAFVDGIDHNYPGPDYDDLMSGVDALSAKGFLDPQHLYVSGCSGGGVLSSWIIGHTDRFAAAAVRCPVTDWMSMAGDSDLPLFTFSFFKKPFWEDPTDWLSHSSLMQVGHVTTPTLLMTGVLDRRTPMPQSEEYFAALKLRGVPVTLLQFDGEYHGTGSKPSNWVRTQLYMMSWFKRYGRGPDGKTIETAEARDAADAKAGS